MDGKDKFLLEQFGNGDIRSFEIIFNRYYKLLTTQAYYYLNDFMEAEDIVQNLFLDIWGKRSSIIIQTSIKSYLQVATKNRCFNLLEKKKVIAKKEEQYKSGLFDVEQNSDHLEVKETAIQFDAFLQILSPKQYQAFSLVHLEDKKYKDAANEMGISINSIKTHLKIAVKILKQKLKNSYSNSSLNYIYSSDITQ